MNRKPARPGSDQRTLAGLGWNAGITSSTTSPIGRLCRQRILQPCSDISMIVTVNSPPAVRSPALIITSARSDLATQPGIRPRIASTLPIGTYLKIVTEAFTNVQSVSA